MATIQNFPEEIKEFILRHQLAAALVPQQATLLPALNQSVDVVVSSLTELARQPGSRDTLWQLARAHADAPLLRQPAPAAAPAPTPDSEAIKSLLQDRYHGTVHNLAAAAGVPADTFAGLLDVVAPVALGLLGQQAAEHNWTADALSGWLQRPQNQQRLAVLPGMLPAAGLNGQDTAAGAARRPPARAFQWGWLAAIVVVGLLGYFLGRQTAGPAPSAQRELPSNALATSERFSLPPVTDARETSWDAANPITMVVDNNFHAAGGYPVVNAANTSPGSGGGLVYGNAGVPVVLKFGDGTQQIIGANSTESRLYQFLANSKVKVDTLNPLNDWINFDRIYFESSKDELSFESKWQLSNIARILNTFPQAKVRIGGYTDSSGDPTYNLKLSRDRAEGARNTLIGLGVNPDNIVASGYGSLDNIASNATPDGRALNRRVSIRVIEKQP